LKEWEKDENGDEDEEEEHKVGAPKSDFF